MQWAIHTHTHRGAQIKMLVNRSKPTEKLQYYLRHVFSSAHFIINKPICLDHHRQHHQYLHIYIQTISSSLRRCECMRRADMRALGHVPCQPLFERKRYSHASLSMLPRFIERKKNRKREHTHFNEHSDVMNMRDIFRSVCAFFCCQILLKKWLATKSLNDTFQLLLLESKDSLESSVSGIHDLDFNTRRGILHALPVAVWIDESKISIRKLSDKLEIVFSFICEKVI